MRRRLAAANIAGLIVFLCSEAVGFGTGSVLPADGICAAAWSKGEFA